MNISTPSEASPYVVEAAKRAARIPSAGDVAQAAFLHVVRAASQAVTVESLIRRALVYSDHLWRTENLDEDEYNAAMIAFCTTLMEGNELAGMLLASAAVWGGSKYV